MKGLLLFSLSMISFISISYSQDNQITKVRDNYAAINKGQNHGIREGQLYIIKRKINEDLIFISEVRVITVRDAIAAIKCLDKSAKLKIDDYLFLKEEDILIDLLDEKYEDILLKDGSVIKGKIIKQDKEILTIENKYGVQNIPLSEISEVKYDKNKKENDKKETDISGFNKAFLYNSQKKRLNTAIGLQALGAGMLYSENYSLGGIMLLAENGLLISSFFVKDQKTKNGLLIGGLVLKVIDTFGTIFSVNTYNKKLRIRLEMEDQILKTNSFKPYTSLRGISPGIGAINERGNEYWRLLLNFTFFNEIRFGGSTYFRYNIGFMRYAKSHRYIYNNTFYLALKLLMGNEKIKFSIGIIPAYIKKTSQYDSHNGKFNLGASLGIIFKMTERLELGLEPILFKDTSSAGNEEIILMTTVGYSFFKHNVK